MQKSLKVTSGLALCLLMAVLPWMAGPRAEAANSFIEVTVKRGDTLTKLAKKHGVEVAAIQRANRLANPDLIRIGQVLRIPGTPRTVSERPQNEEKAPVPDVPVLMRGQGLGSFMITAYTAGPESTGKHVGEPGYGITSSGQPVNEGVTIAVDPEVIPIGSRVYIEGIGYRIAQDTGSKIKGKRIDLYMNSVAEARAFGVKRNVRVELVE
ncbi:3D (Asp-Asp-Asp) domain-containing protein [Laceyella tengchongensis]|uniref:3D (Asp-Asp-Asp) domain-containing protein n=1 Tax=Laceyella tengchongensis TaxID=574699 RepID=A0AA46AH16_9BACL|nr:3D domain-containing protein [Laceyella tengchongensis]SMP34422.1 3D (Asp-Asp-Asp) domain-containing protein [Laceyella tengchongensis]